MTQQNEQQPHPLDVHIGARLRDIRAARKVSQSALADQLGLTFQQVQKYEKGLNRLSARSLFEVARFLNVPRDYFYDGYDNEDPAPVLTAPDYPFLEALNTIQSAKLRFAIRGFVMMLAETDKK